MEDFVEFTLPWSQPPMYEAMYFLSVACSEPAADGTRRCLSCWRATSGIKRCTGCKMVFYCNVNCQKRHWKAHRSVCRSAAARARARAEQELLQLISVAREQGDTAAKHQKHACANISCNHKNAKKLCSRCKTSLYCSAACQKVHWKEHKKTCVPLEKMAGVRFVEVDLKIAGGGIEGMQTLCATVSLQVRTILHNSVFSLCEGLAVVSGFTKACCSIAHHLIILCGVLGCHI